jgi:hypothetical protein
VIVTRILACGSRGWTDESIIRLALSSFGFGDVLIHGCAAGADTIAGKIGQELGMAVERYPADWTRLGRRAGILRNQRMLSEGKPDLGLDFDLGTRGTADMVGRMLKAGIQVSVFHTDGRVDRHPANSGR